MKKHFLFLATLVLGLGQLFADDVTFSVSDLKATLPADNSNIAIPYTWKAAPYHVSVTIAKQDGTDGTLAVSNVLALNNTYQVTVSVAGEGILSGAKITTNPSGNAKNATASTGTYDNGSWAASENGTSSVTFTCTGTFRLQQIYVEYTPDPNYNPVDPVDPNEPIEATPIDNIMTYTGTDPYVYDRTGQKFYALNSLGDYEEYGVFTEVKTLKVAGAGATEIEYIKGNGSNPYINLNYIPKANSKAVCTLISEEGPDWKAAYGCGYYKDGWKDRFCFFTTNATINLGGETGNKEAMVYGEKITTVLDAAEGKMDIYKEDGTLNGTITDSPKTADCKTPLYVFAQNKDVPDGGTQTDCYNPYMTLYSLKLYEGETLVMDLVPVVTGEGKGGLKDKLTGNVYTSANSGNFDLSPDAADAGEAGIPVYEGKMVVYNGSLYEYANGAWVKKGALTYQPVRDLDPAYRNLSNWSYPGSAYDDTFGVNVYDEATGGNRLDPYEGKGGWEPLYFKIEGLTKGNTYRASFNYSGTAWHSWSSYTILPFFVLDYETMPGTSFNDPDQALGYIPLPNTETINQPYSTSFTANHDYALLCIQFGVVDDGSHDPAFAFEFNNITIEQQIYPAAYREITFADLVKYTELEYIESTGASRENAYTLPYNPVTATQIDAKFNVYDTSSGWTGIFSARNTHAGTGISLYMNGNNRAFFGYFTGGTTGAGDEFAPFELNTDYTVSADVTKLVVNGEEYPTGNTTTNPTTRNLSLFANPEWDNPMRGRYYYCTISEGGEVLYSFKPAMRHDGVFGFYDKATKTFVMPAKGTLEGYGYKKLADEVYVTFSDELRIVMVGTTAQFMPDVDNWDGATFTWTSSDESIATVAQDGTVTGVTAGKVTITAETEIDGGWTASYELTVSEPNFIRKDADGVGYAVVTGGNGWYQEGSYDFRVDKLCDGDATTNFGCNGEEDAWAIFIASEPVAVKQYSIVTGYDNYEYPAQNPVSWKLEGSNDNNVWTLIDERVQTYELQAKNLEEFVFPVNDTEKYKFFKFTATQLVGGLELGEFWINEEEHNYGSIQATVTDATCTKPGSVVFICAMCNALHSEVIDCVDHTYEKGVCTVCGAKASEVVLLPNGQEYPYYAKFVHVDGVLDGVGSIEEDWTSPDFDDSEWGELMMPLGTNGYGVQHTIWANEYNSFFFRRNFYVDDPSLITKLTLKTLHDDDYAVYVNGTLIHEATGWTNGTNWVVLDVDPALLVQGKNTVAMYIEQNWGGAYCDFSLEGVVGATVVVTDAKYATFVAPFDVDFTDNEVSAFAVSLNDETGRATLIPVTTVPGGTAVVVKAEEGSYGVAKTTDAELGAENELKAAIRDVITDGSQYILAKKESGVGFYKAEVVTTIETGKGYLELEAPATVKSFYPIFGEDATGISGINAEDENALIYNIAGQRVNKAQKGVNIINGIKVLK
jgi:hypothetical protein